MYRLLSRTSRAHTARQCEGQEPGTDVDPQETRPSQLTNDRGKRQRRQDRVVPGTPVTTWTLGYEGTETGQVL